jgi:lysyl-tRNA synthetase class 2
MCEVETPILRSWYDLVCVDQFTSKDIAGISLHMRLCHEDRLKQLVSGGFERVYELGKSFRRSDISWKHSPEFTQLETIQAYTDYRDMMKHAEDLISIVTRRTIDRTEINGRRGDTINLLPPWKRITVKDAILEHTGIDIYKTSSTESLRQEIEKHVRDTADRSLLSPAVENEEQSSSDVPTDIQALPPEPYCNWFYSLVEHCLETFVTPNLIQPTIVLDYPLDSNWQVKRKKDRPDYLERFEAYIDGIEIANCYTLVNDPVDFVERLEDQLGWYCRAFGRGEYPLDLALIQAKGYGLPPMSESSFGIDRWLMMACEQENIQDVIWMPYPYI